MEVADRDEMFNILCEMSDRQVDRKVKDRLKAFLGRPNEEIKDELLGLVDDIVFYSWTSDFEIKVLEQIWCGCGGSMQELHSRKVEDTPENRAKYKWQR